jgi:membrane protease YdiL (CAAX protease family)
MKNSSVPNVPEAPSYLELGLILLTGVLHWVVEFWGRGKTIGLVTPDQLYNFAAIGVWGGYVLWRLAATRGIGRAWGFRADNFFEALKPSLLFVACGAVPILVYGNLAGHVRPPAGFGLVLWLYPLYGIAQQFALQALVVRNLRSIVGARSARALAAGAIFSAAHFPVAPLMILTAPAGVAFTLIYEARPNLWAVGLAHGLLGALAYYFVLGLDPGAQILGILRSLFGGMVY